MTGPYETEQQARELPAVRVIYDAFERDPGVGKMTPHCRRILDDACSPAGVETGCVFLRGVLFRVVSVMPLG